MKLSFVLFGEGSPEQSDGLEACEPRIERTRRGDRGEVGEVGTAR